MIRKLKHKFGYLKNDELNLHSNLEELHFANPMFRCLIYHATPTLEPFTERDS